MFNYMFAIVFVAAAANVSGYDALIEDHPYQVSLKHRGQHLCAGSIISPYYIVTAGHCIAEISPLTVHVGSTFKGYGGNDHRVEKTILHENYSINSTGVVSNDVALIKLKQPLVYSDKVQPIKLYKSGEESTPGVRAKITGWSTLTTSRLQAVDSPIVSKQLCNDAYHKYGGIVDGQICAYHFKEGGKDPCQRADSGGSLVMNGRLAGIVSWGKGCSSTDYFGVYTEVAHYRKWIDQNAELA